MALIKADTGTNVRDVLRGSALSNIGGVTGTPAKDSFAYTAIQNLDDVILGGDGNDVIIGDRYSLDVGEIYGADTLYGGRGNDTIYVNTGPEDAKRYLTVSKYSLAGEQAFGGSGNDQIFGAASSDVLRGESGHDVLRGYGGDDDLYGGSGSDVIIGGKGADYLAGGAGNDVLHENDALGYLHGEAGDDRIYCTGATAASGGTGQDRFYFSKTKPAVAVNILDFSSRDDTLCLSASSFRILGKSVGKDEFRTGQAKDGNDHLLYIGEALYFDPDGSGTDQAIVIGIFRTGASTPPPLTYGDFLIT